MRLLPHLASAFRRLWKSDILVANWNPGTISILLSTGDGTFLNQTNYPTGKGPSSIAVIDVNSDNKPDIVVANYDSNDVSVLLQSET